MRNERLEEAKQYFMNSNIANLVSEDKIDKAIDNSYVCGSEKELYDLYQSKTGTEYDGTLKGFNNGSKNYFPPDFTPHAAIHETLHTLSSTFNEEGRRLVNGIEVKDTVFGRFVNEGLTEYLTTKICNEPPEAYSIEVSFFKNIDENFSEYFESNMALEDMYINNKTDMLKEFVNLSLNKEDINFDDIKLEFFPMLETLSKKDYLIKSFNHLITAKNYAPSQKMKKIINETMKKLYGTSKKEEFLEFLSDTSYVDKILPNTEKSKRTKKVH